ncbi:MAG: hypothetical protein K6G79_06530 [Bacteroidales bacterium]|nr:hypothetical protein [Bacteroidales bacterium]
METRKGFITVATGRDVFYIMAHNLLLSYRYHTKAPMPFAILCDRHNEWTADFDQVVIIEDPAHSYYDKLRILDLSPFDETMFIDADCLAYKDLNGLWDIFRDSPDIGLVGHTLPNDSERGWWKHENLGELKDKVDFKVMCQGGLYYVRNNGKDLPAIKETCKFIEDHYLDYHFSIFEKVLEDETILCLAAAVHHIEPVTLWDKLFAYYPETRCLSADIRTGRFRHIWKDGPGKPNTEAFFIHFGTLNTLGSKSDGIYYREVYRLKYHPDRRQDLKDRLSLFARRMVNHNRFFHAIANLFPKELRNRYSQVKSRGREHVC